MRRPEIRRADLRSREPLKAAAPQPHRKLTQVAMSCALTGDPLSRISGRARVPEGGCSAAASQRICHSPRGVGTAQCPSGERYS